MILQLLIALLRVTGLGLVMVSWPLGNREGAGVLGQLPSRGPNVGSLYFTCRSQSPTALVKQEGGAVF
jgi:hypothetical protein